MWMKTSFILAIGNPTIFLIYFFLQSSVPFIADIGIMSVRNDVYTINIFLYAVIAFIMHGIWSFIQYKLVKWRNVVDTNTYFRTKFWVMSLLPIFWGYFLMYKLITTGVLVDEMVFYTGAGSFWAAVMMFIFMYQFRVGAFKGELST